MWSGTCLTRRTGLTMEQLWNRHCYAEHYGFHAYQDGDTVEFDFEAISQPQLERMIEIKERLEDVDFPEPDNDTYDPWVWEDHNRYYPVAGLDVTEIYTTIQVRCLPGPASSGFPWSIILIRAITDFVDPIAMRAAAEARIQLPEPIVASNPPLDQPGRHGVVHIPTWLWIENDWTEVGPETEEDGPAVVAVAAFPTYVHWNMGDGGARNCTGPGIPWASGMTDDQTYCSYTYELSSASSGADAAYDLSATTYYTFVWWVNGTYLGPFGPGSVTTDFTYQVGEIQAVES